MGLDNRLEPSIYVDLTETDERSITEIMTHASIAISLKRIADTLEHANLNGDILANAIEGAIYRGLKSG